jgi:hypothetical protein
MMPVRSLHPRHPLLPQHALNQCVADLKHSTSTAATSFDTTPQKMETLSEVIPNVSIKIE